jgi:hypothetical protein
MATERVDARAHPMHGRSSRRSTLGLSLAGVLAALPSRGTAAKKKKKKCPRCPVPETCPASCVFIYHEVSGKTLCGTGNGAQFPCKQCASSAECATFPNLQCVRNLTRVSDGQILDFSPGCGFAYPNGVCVSVFACPT